MKPNIATMRESIGSASDITSSPSQTIGTSIRKLQFDGFSIDSEYSLPLAIGDFRFARFDGAESGLTIQLTSSQTPDTSLPDRGARIGLLLALQLERHSMMNASITVWVGEQTEEKYFEAYLDFEDGTHEQIDFLKTENPVAMSFHRCEMPARSITAIWLMASPKILLMEVSCSVKTDA